MNDEKIYQKLRIANEFQCDRHVNSENRGQCNGCDYFYIDERISVSRCLKRNISDWARYYIEES
jgi:hypothetical protein